MTEIPIFPAGGPVENISDLPAPGDVAGILHWIGQGLHGIRSNLPDPRRVRLEKARSVYAVRIDPVPIPISGGNGILDLSGLFSPSLGYNWDVHTISATGFTGGSVTGWINLSPSSLSLTAAAPSGALRFAAISAGGFANYGKNQCFLRAGDRLVWVAQGVTAPTGQVLVSLDATSMTDEFVGEYLV